MADEQQSPAINILTSALAQVDEVLTKAEATIQLLQSNLQQTNAQKIGLSHSKGMLTELIERIKKAELIKARLSEKSVETHPSDSDNK